MMMRKLAIAAALFMFALPLAAADESLNGAAQKETYENVPPGTLVMPGEREATGRQSENQRKCMKVCKKWGETCIIDPRTGVRKCRRSCEQFGVECF